jgi:predicted metal-dependent HD superfamily phosphohydrolase
VSVYRYLAERWQRTLALVRPLNLRESDNLLSDICQRYSEDQRHYHTVDHLRYCFETLDVEMAKLVGTGAIELALWYHDIVYDPRASDNEAKSAQLAYSAVLSLGFTTGFALQISNLVLATSHKNVPGQREAKVLLDIDTAILGASVEVYDEFERNIRKEYSWVSEPDYKTGRTKVLRSFLDRPWIYSTPELRNGPREGMARTNLSRAIRALSGTDVLPPA